MLGFKTTWVRKVTGVLTNEEVVAALLTQQYKGLIIGGGVGNSTRQIIISLLQEKILLQKLWHITATRLPCRKKYKMQ